MKSTRFFTRCLLLAAMFGFLPVAGAAVGQGKYEPTWESLDSRPTPKWFTDAKFGIFIFWGVYSVPAWVTKGHYSEWYWQRYRGSSEGRPYVDTRKFHIKNYGKNFKYQDFAALFKAELFDPDQWADVFLRAGAKYIVLASKHHDGFCLWPSEQANRTWGRPWNCVDIGPKRDLLGDLTEAVRKKGLKMGFYYSLYEWYNPLWLTDKKRYIEEHMHPQFKDVVTRYKPSIIFSDGEWDLPSSEWKTPELLAWLFNKAECRNEVVINDRWGKGERHKHGGYYTTEYGPGLKDASHPWEENRGIGHSFGYNRNESLSDYKSVKELILMLADIVSRGGNLLLDIGPTADGRIPVIMEERLIQIGQWLKVNGEAIYGTSAWRKTCQWSAGQRPQIEYGKQYMAKYDISEITGKPRGGKAVIEAFFTSKDNTLYAIAPHWPGKELVLNVSRPSVGTVVTMLGRKGDLPWRYEAGRMYIDVSGITINELPCRHAYTFKIAGDIRP